MIPPLPQVNRQQHNSRDLVTLRTYHTYIGVYIIDSSAICKGSSMSEIDGTSHPPTCFIDGATQHSSSSQDSSCPNYSEHSSLIARRDPANLLLDAVGRSSSDNSFAYSSDKYHDQLEVKIGLIGDAQVFLMT